LESGMNEVYSWIKNIVIYMFMNTIVMNLLGNKSYKKYVSIVSGMILVLIVISPFMNYMELEDKLDYFIQANDFAVETSDFQTDVNRMEKEQRDVIFEEYIGKVKAKIEDLLLGEGVYAQEINVTIDQESDSSTFGEILRLDITASLEQNEGAGENRLSIDEIDIARIRMKDGEDTSKAVPSPMEIDIKSKLSDFYNIEQDNININIQGE